MEHLRRSPVRGVLNFTPAQLRSDPSCQVHNLDIRLEIEKLFCMVQRPGTMHPRRGIPDRRREGAK
jgi:NADH/NAD ratio-sensing transcriptional regulator Rex